MDSLHIRPTLCAAVLLLAAGCATPAHPPAKAQAAHEPVSVQAFSFNPFFSVTLPPSRIHSHEEAIRALGTPAEVLTKQAPGEHDPTIVNSVITLRYAFGELVYLRVSGKDVENLILIQLHGNQAALRYGIRFGETTRDQVLKLFGKPQDTQDNSVSYNVLYTEEITNPTTFYFHDNVLIEIDISSLMMD
ncbi:MAG: hypothetical protein ACLQCB_04660 [Spirochaetia bacterium]